MVKYIAVFLVGTIFITGFVSMFLAIFHTSRMFCEARSSKECRVQLIPWAAFAFPSSLTDMGRKHRTKMLVYLSVALSCAASLVILNLITSQI